MSVRSVAAPLVAPSLHDDRASAKKEKSPQPRGRAGFRVGWRREGDSNPRDARAPNGFQDRRIQPLCHLSVW